MPKLKESLEVQQNSKMVANIKYGMFKQHVNNEELALAARVTKPTLYERYRNPSSFRLCELRLISQKLHIPLLTLLNGVLENRDETGL